MAERSLDHVRIRRDKPGAVFSVGTLNESRDILRARRFASSAQERAGLPRKFLGPRSHFGPHLQRRCLIYLVTKPPSSCRLHRDKEGQIEEILFRTRDLTLNQQGNHIGGISFQAGQNLLDQLRIMAVAGPGFQIIRFDPVEPNLVQAFFTVVRCAELRSSRARARN